ncbi:hypothetical protein NW759_006497 [Fusarium solani]|nr:hypothetical protein NW759_006497 [Fusarium solani]
MSHSEEEDLQEELGLAGLFGPGHDPLPFDALNDEMRVALVHLHNALVMRMESEEDRLDYLDEQQDELEDLANRLSKDKYTAKDEVFLVDLAACTDWLKELLDLVEDLRLQE